MSLITITEYLHDNYLDRNRRDAMKDMQVIEAAKYLDNISKSYKRGVKCRKFANPLKFNIKQK